LGNSAAGESVADHAMIAWQPPAGRGLGADVTPKWAASKPAPQVGGTQLQDAHPAPAARRQRVQIEQTGLAVADLGDGARLMGFDPIAELPGQDPTAFHREASVTSRA
jgi:hypothetical protein